jgi:hypothetical protein
MIDKRFGRDSAERQADAASPRPGETLHADNAASTWPANYAPPRLKKFGTLTELTLSGTASGNFETNILTRKFRPKPKS